MLDSMSPLWIPGCGLLAVACMYIDALGFACILGVTIIVILFLSPLKLDSTPNNDASDADASVSVSDDADAVSDAPSAKKHQMYDKQRNIRLRQQMMIDLGLKNK